MFAPRFLVGLVLGAVLVGCGDHDSIYAGDPGFDPPGPGDIIPARWIQVAILQVKGQPVYDAVVKVGVKGIQDTRGNKRCELVLNDKRFRADRPWSPEPIAFYSPNYKSPDGTEDLNDLFRTTLSFEVAPADPQSITFKATFTRGKTFASQWRIHPFLSSADGQEVCAAIATLDWGPQVACHNSVCRVTSIVVTADSWRYIFQSNKPPTEIDDLTALTLNLEDVDELGVPNGQTYSYNVPEFK
ncbi:MAG: hypothetical protein HYR96_04235 [Deltaproteobacteria bacterium]|nr:hypothetical protein [Deltaproteobacteria bacterium]MBI3294598.1 hypothetical protein [Deltaproteobacteria bacterium]